ncbi:MAG: flagellar hook-associated protein FlgL [Candidatus Zixiibacteriota bacterium]
MRVTEQMMVSRSTSNLASAATRLLRLQTQMSSGRRIATPSDDPSGVTRALSFRTTRDALQQFKSNVSYSNSQLATVEQALSSAGTLLVRARELAVTLANDDYDATARRAAAQEAQSILDQLLQLANSQRDGRYLFSGFRTRSQALVASGNGVVYQGDNGTIYAQIESASQMAINLIGSELFLSQQQVLGEGFDLKRGVAAAVPLADLHLGAGVDLTPGTIVFTDENSGAAVTVDLSAATTVGDAITAINTQLVAGGISGVTVSVSSSGRGLSVAAADNGIVGSTTQLANLHGTAGVDLVPGIFHIGTEDGSIDVAIDLTGVQTIGDVITAFNTQMAAAAVSQGNPALANVTMAVNAGQTGLVITDANATPLGLTVTDSAEQSTASDLGIVGFVNAQLVGTDLDPARVVTIAEGGVGQTTAADLGILGTLTRAREGDALDPRLTLTTPVSELNFGQGVNLGQLRIAQGADAVVVDLSTAATVNDIVQRLNLSGVSVTAAINSSGRGIRITPTVADRSLIVSDFGGGQTATALGIAGSPDLMGSMMLLVQALENDDRAAVGTLLGNLEKVSDHMLSARADVGAKIRRLDTTSDRLDDVNLLVTKLLSEVEDADILKVTTDLATQQSVYQAALNAVSRVLMPSLADFMQ